jgi:MFS family permease
MDSGAIRLARDALATPELRRLQVVAAAAGVGGWAFMVSLAVHAYVIGGAAAVGLAALVRMAPAGLAAPLTGLAADRFPRRDVLLASVLARALLLGGAALIVALDGPFALLLVVATLFTIAATAHKPAQAALLPRLAPARSRQAAANALWTGLDNGAFVLGAIAGGLLVAGFGAAAAFAASGAAFVAAALALASIARDRGVSEMSPSRPRNGHTPALEGLRVVARDRRLRLLVGVLSVSTLLEGMIDVLVVVTALHLVNLGDAGAGWLNAAWGIGGMVGGVLALRLLGRGRLGVSLPVGGMLIGLPLLALANVPGAVTALVALLVLGVGYALVESTGTTLLQRLAHDGVRARAFAVVESSYWLTTGAGAMLAPAVIALVGVRGALAVVGAVLPLLMLSRWGALTRLAPAATAARPAAASAAARPGLAASRSPAAATGARPALQAAHPT